MISQAAKTAAHQHSSNTQADDGEGTGAARLRKEDHHFQADPERVHVRVLSATVSFRSHARGHYRTHPNFPPLESVAFVVEYRRARRLGAEMIGIPVPSSFTVMHNVSGPPSTVGEENNKFKSTRRGLRE